MTEDKIIAFLERLGCRRIYARGDEVYSTCPFEEFHKHGTDRKPSFAAKIDLHENSPYFCHACHNKGFLEFLAYSRGMPEFCSPVTIDLDTNWLEIPKDNRKVFGKKEIPENEVFILPEKAINEFQGRVHNQLFERGVNKETARAWGLGYDDYNMRMIFVVRDCDKKLRGVSGRTIVDHPVKYAHYNWDTKKERLVPWIDYSRASDFIGFKKGKVLYGEHMVRDNILVVTEGHLDAVLVWQAGFSGVAIMGSYPTSQQVKKLVRLSAEKGGKLIAMFDADDHGERCTKRLVEFVNKRVPVLRANIPEGKKDPGDMTEAEIKKAVNNAFLILD